MSRIEDALEKALESRDVVSEKKTASENKADTNCPVDFDQHENLNPVQITTKYDNPVLVSANEPCSYIAEEYRKLKENIITRTRSNGDFNNTIMVTSPLVGEGKTVTALNLAISFAQEFDYTVLLIDTDLRRPMCAKYLGFDVPAGITDVLIDGKDISDVLIDTGIGKLKLLPAGKVIDNPSELLSSNKMRALFQEIKTRYKDRFVVIDTLPILPFSESRIISSLVDGVVLVIREKYSSFDDINESLQMVRGAEVHGIVYNAAKIEAPLSHYNYYKYYSAYARDKKSS